MLLTILTYITVYFVVGMLAAIGICLYVDDEDYGHDEAHTVLFLWPLVLAASIYYYVTDEGDDDG
jgi:hypothetical protein